MHFRDPARDRREAAARGEEARREAAPVIGARVLPLEEEAVVREARRDDPGHLPLVISMAGGVLESHGGVVDEAYSTCTGAHVRA